MMVASFNALSRKVARPPGKGARATEGAAGKVAPRARRSGKVEDQSRAHRKDLARQAAYRLLAD